MNSLQRFFSAVFLLLIGFGFLSTHSEEVVCVDETGQSVDITCFEGYRIIISGPATENEGAFWMHGYYGMKHQLKDGDTILNNSYIYIPFEDGTHFDTSVYCFDAIDDRYEIKKEDWVILDVLENDHGENIRISKVRDYYPYLNDSIFLDSVQNLIHYKSMDLSNTSYDYLRYEITNEFGATDEAYVRLGFVEIVPFSISWDYECINNEDKRLIKICLEGGTPPYDIEGSFNEMDIENTEFEFTIEGKNGFNISITDSEGSNQSLNISTLESCLSEPHYNAHSFDVWHECLEGGKAKIIFDIPDGLQDAVVQAYYGSDRKPLKHLDTIRRNVYYYVEVATWGHVDGWTLCQSEVIEAKDDTLEFIAGLENHIYYKLTSNDSGNGLMISQIVEGTECGIIRLNIDNYGNATYKAPAIPACIEDSFSYEITDAFGGKDTAKVWVTSKVLELEDDTVTVYAGIETKLRYKLLKNDFGLGKRISNIVSSYDCADFTIEDNELFYQSPSVPDCEFDVFEYEVTDKFGVKDTAQVVVYFRLMEAEDDHISITAGLKTNVSYLRWNDTGYGLFFSNIVETPQCGTLELEGKNLYYQSPPIPDCHSDFFRYEVTDEAGAKDTASVEVNIHERSLGVEHECIDCIESDLYGIFITGGIPPYTLSGDLDTVITEMGLFQFEIEDPVSLQVWVEDGVGAREEVFEYTPCSCKHIPCIGPNYDAYGHEIIIDCHGDGTVVPYYGNGFWIDSETGENHAFGYPDTIPDLVYIYGGESQFMIDTFINCITPTDDFYELLFGVERELKVIENDQGQEIYISDILQHPSCGEITHFYNSRIKYKASENMECVKDSFVYEITNAVGQKDTATVWIDLVEQKPLSIEWEQECAGWEDREMYFYIDGGLPPFDIEGFFDGIRSRL